MGLYNLDLRTTAPDDAGEPGMSGVMPDALIAALCDVNEFNALQDEFTAATRHLDNLTEMAKVAASSIGLCSRGTPLTRGEFDLLNHDGSMNALTHRTLTWDDAQSEYLTDMCLEGLGEFLKTVFDKIIAMLKYLGNLFLRIVTFGRYGNGKKSDDAIAVVTTKSIEVAEKAKLELKKPVQPPRLTPKSASPSITIKKQDDPAAKSAERSEQPHPVVMTPNASKSEETVAMTLHHISSLNTLVEETRQDVALLSGVARTLIEADTELAGLVEKVIALRSLQTSDPSAKIEEFARAQGMARQKLEAGLARGGMPMEKWVEQMLRAFERRRDMLPAAESEIRLHDRHSIDEHLTKYKRVQEIVRDCNGSMIATGNKIAERKKNNDVVINALNAANTGTFEARSMEHITNRQALIEALLGAVKLITFGFTQYGKAAFAYYSATLPLAVGIARDINRLKEAGTKLTK